MDINTRFEECEIYTISSSNSPNIYAGFTIQPLRLVKNQYLNKYRKYLNDEEKYLDVFEHFPNLLIESQKFIQVISHYEGKEELLKFCEKYNYIPILKQPRHKINSTTKKEEKLRKYQNEYYKQRSKKIVNCHICDKMIQLTSYLMHKKSKTHLENLEIHSLS